ncbi:MULTISPECIES: hypothetical protein [Nocardia]|uniref:hypothetical protein n=1 Tax=Nocardia TaxID=1817 RepID=UPI002454D670|nr:MULTISPECIES: hypothetical protein [Nocardia]
MTRREPHPKPPKLFSPYPAKQYRRLVMRHGERGRLYDFAFQFSETANRLADSFTGQPYDDTILIPWLYLHRHAAELVMKDAILRAAQLRRRGGDTDSSLDPSVVKERLKGKLRHRLMALLDELDKHLQALELDRTPPETRRTLAHLSELDPSGESFRYDGGLPKHDDRIDFPALDKALRSMYAILAASIDVLEQYADWQNEMLDAVPDESPGDDEYRELIDDF